MLHIKHYGLGATPAVEELQKALVRLSEATKSSAYHPGPITGDVNTKTISALLAALRLHKEQTGVAFNLPSPSPWHVASLAEKLTSLVLAMVQRPSERVIVRTSERVIAERGLLDPSRRTIQDQIVRESIDTPNEEAAALVKLIGNAPYAVAAYDPKRKTYRVAVPKKFAPPGLGQPQITETNHIEIGELAFEPKDIRVVVLALDEYKKLTRKWYQKPLWWAVGAGILTAGVAGGYAWHKKRA